MRSIRQAPKPLLGAVSVPGDKSISHRAIMLGALCEKGLRVRGLADGEDVKSTRRCLEALGIRIREENGETIINETGVLPAKPVGRLDCGNSGTTMRLLAGILAGQPFDSELCGDASLSRRPMGRVADPLNLMGARVSLSPADRPPLTVRGRRPLRSIHYRLPVPSAQVKSAVLLAGLFADGPSTVEDGFHTRDHTERMLRWLSDREEPGDRGGAPLGRGTVATVEPRPLKGGMTLVVPGDISSAAFFFAAAALVPGSRLTVRNVGLNPTRTGFLDALREMGGKVETFAIREEGGEPVGDVTASYSPLSGMRLSPDRAPSLIDEAPLLAVLAACASGTTRLEGLGELRHKESDRLEGMAAGLGALGAKVEIQGDCLVIQGTGRLRGGAVKTLGDHRLAMAFATAGLAAEGGTSLDDEACVSISYPRFFETLEGLLG